MELWAQILTHKLTLASVAEKKKKGERKRIQD